MAHVSSGADALVEQWNDQRIVLGRPGTLVGCWWQRNHQRIDQLPDWRPLRPSGWPDESAMFNRAEAVLGAAREDRAHNRLLLYATSQYRDYIEAWPATLRAAAGPFGEWQWWMLLTLAQEPDFARFVATELAAVGPHFIRLCLDLGGGATWNSTLRRALARRIMHEPRDALVAELAGTTSFRGLARMAMKLIGDLIRLAEVVGTLELFREQPEGWRFLCHEPVLSVGGVLALNEWQPPLCRLAVFDWLDVADRVDRLEMAIGRPLASLTLAEATTLAARIAALPPGGELDDRAMEPLRRLPDLPSPPWGGNALLRPVTTAHGLRAEGRAMHHCVGAWDYMQAAAAGTYAVYEWRGETRGTLGLHRGTDGTWRIHALLGPANAELPRRDWLRVAAMLRLAMGRRFVLPPSFPAAPVADRAT